MEPATVPLDGDNGKVADVACSLGGDGCVMDEVTAGAGFDATDGTCWEREPAAWCCRSGQIEAPDKGNPENTWDAYDVDCWSWDGSWALWGLGV